ncbi:MAG: flagellar biosynthesis anti-sigma factor FlgM [Gammaproteobacteria bacterium]
MAEKIDGPGRAGIPPARSNGPRETNRQHSTEQPSAADQAKPEAVAGERVELTASAQSLRKLEAQLAAKSEVDEKRVAEVKTRIAEGRFDIDPRRVADKLLRTEKDL